MCQILMTQGLTSIQYHQDTPHHIWFLLLAHSQLQENVSSTQLFRSLYICVHCTAASHQIWLKGKKQSFSLCFVCIDNYICFKSLCLSAGWQHADKEELSLHGQQGQGQKLRDWIRSVRGVILHVETLPSGAVYLSCVHTVHAMEAIAKYDFKATADDELSFKRGEILKVSVIYCCSIFSFLSYCMIKLWETWYLHISIVYLFILLQ